MYNNGFIVKWMNGKGVRGESEEAAVETGLEKGPNKA
jgi:hypothetical protein